jgi:hypothetical protein
MQCDDFLGRWHDLLDQRRDPAADDALRDHARQCDSCGAWLDDWATLAPGLGDAAPTIKAPHFRARRSTARWSSLAVAAAAVWLLVATWPASPAPERVPSPQVAMSRLPTAPGPPATTAEPRPAELQPSVPGPTSATASPPQQLDLQRIRLTVGEPDWWGSVMVSALRPVDPLAESIRPLTDSLQTALELLTPRSGAGAKAGPGKNTSWRAVRRGAHWA